MKVIQDVLGHADIGTTMNIYADATEDLKSREFQSFSDYLNKESGQEKDSPKNMAVDVITVGKKAARN